MTNKISIHEEQREINAKGEFQRQKNRFDTPFGENAGELPVESGRYRLLWAEICPWAHRAVIVRELLGLKDVISLGTASPVRTEHGWEFSLDENGVDPVLNIRYLPEIYAQTDEEYTGRATVPTVVDVQTKKVVNNDYFRLTNYLEVAFQKFHKKNAPDLYPRHLRKEIDAFNEILFHDVNNGVYKAGFARSQEAYEKAYDTLFERLDELEERLGSSRYLFGDEITDSDIRLYVTLVRFDAAYYSVFRVNRNRLIDFPNLWNYAKDLYQTKGFGNTTNFDAIKKGYQLGNVSSNPFNILAKGPRVENWLEPHNREKLTKEV
ncbi:putative glutathione S-transferase [Pilibacter termitis]|uniref:Putative glutathione S-transferase n=1 Tax=Pilibacter termitis TaxID=263852 RepID=A0A1T4QCK4_9ENTE|nr:glutathione S-transferase C-terminal domain-containing protein [Pilibacter termitis]SKA01520.1 putative glutathione S-transferase [Pilibacter termitis]